MLSFVTHYINGLHLSSGNKGAAPQNENTPSQVKVLHSNHKSKYENIKLMQQNSPVRGI